MFASASARFMHEIRCSTSPLSAVLEKKKGGGGYQFRAIVLSTYVTQVTFWCLETTSADGRYCVTHLDFIERSGRKLIGKLSRVLYFGVFVRT